MMTMCARIVLCLALVAALRADAASTAALKDPPPSADVRRALDLERQIVDTIKRVVPAYVFIGGGSGVLISADGLMLTNHHVAGTSKRWKVRVGSKWYEADILGNDPRGDISLLKIKDAANMPFVEFAESDKLTVGQQVIAVGNPFGAADIAGDPTVTLGIISALRRFQGNYSDAIQTDAAINPGNSGGPLLTMDGKLAGINGMITSKNGERANTGIGLAIPAKQIQRFLPQLKSASGGNVRHGLIRGLISDGDESDGIQNGAEIKEVGADSPAQKMGFLAGDRITHVDDYSVHNYVRLLGVIGTYPAGSELKIRGVRDGKPLALTVKLDPILPPSWDMDFRKAKKAQDPVVIDKVHPNGAAEKAGLKPGDAIIGMNSRPLNALMFDMFQRLGMRNVVAGDTLNLKLKRTENDKVEEKNVVFTFGAALDKP